MAVTIKNVLNSKYWQESRKYSKAEALIYLINRPSNMSIRSLATAWQWSRSSVERFIADLKKEKMWDTFWDTFWDTKRANNKRVAENLGTHSGTLFGTHHNKNNTPLILSTTNVVSNIYPPKGESTHIDADFEKFQSWIRENAPRVAKMKEPFTAEQVAALKADFDQQFICDLLKAMHNYEPLLTKNRSANLTFRNWAKREKRNSNEQKRTTNTAGDTKSRLEGVLRAAANGYARAHTPQEW